MYLHPPLSFFCWLLLYVLSIPPVITLLLALIIYIKAFWYYDVYVRTHTGGSDARQIYTTRPIVFNVKYSSNNNSQDDINLPLVPPFHLLKCRPCVISSHQYFPLSAFRILCLQSSLQYRFSLFFLACIGCVIIFKFYSYHKGQELRSNESFWGGLT